MHAKMVCESKTGQKAMKLKPFWTRSRSHKITFSPDFALLEKPNCGQIKEGLICIFTGLLYASAVLMRRDMTTRDASNPDEPTWNHGYNTLRRDSGGNNIGVRGSIYSGLVEVGGGIRIRFYART